MTGIHSDTGVHTRHVNTLLVATPPLPSKLTTPHKEAMFTAAEQGLASDRKR